MDILRAVKKVLPVPLKRVLRRTYDGYQFRAQPRLEMQAANLRRESDLPLADIMHDPQIAEAFARDHSDIAELYGKGELLAGVNPGDRRAIYHLVAYLRPKRVLEIGTHIGMSTVYIGRAVRSFSPAGASVTTVDVLDVNAPDAPWREADLSAPPRVACDRLGTAVEFVKSPALDFMRESRDRYELIFLDGDHSSRAVYREISTALTRLAPNGVILLHDYYPDCKPLTPEGSVITGPAEAGQRIQSESPHVKVVPLGALPWPTKAGGNFTSLAVVLSQGQIAHSSH